MLPTTRRLLVVFPVCCVMPGILPGRPPGNICHLAEICWQTSVMPGLHHLPPQLSSFVGRAGEIAAIGEAVTAGRVLTLAGPGGCGKTRLAARVGRDRDDAYWIGLEQESDPGRIAHRVAEALDVLLPPGLDPLPALVAALRDRDLLAVLDNCEHVLDDAARVVAALLAGCPGIAVLATSRA